MKKRLAKIIIALLIIFSFVPVGKAFAGGYANIGTAPTGGSCNYNAVNWWWDTCFGYSWQMYYVKKDLPAKNAAASKQVHFHYTSNTNSNGAVNLNYCKKGQTLFNYGFEVFMGNGWGSVSLGYQVSTQSDKNGVQARWRKVGKKYQALGAYRGAYDTTANYLVASGYADANSVKKAYNKMMRDDSVKNWLPNNLSWDNVGYFCYTPGFTLTVKYYDRDTQKSIATALNYKERPEDKYAVVSHTDRKVDAGKYRFIGWSTAPNGNIITRTTEDKKNYKPYATDADGNKKFNSGKNAILKKAHVFMNKGKEIYALYTYIHHLTKNTDAGVKSLTINRTSSPYSSNTNNLGNKSEIFKGDNLSICVTLNKDYELTEFYVEGPNKAVEILKDARKVKKYCGSTKRYKVAGDTKVVAKTKKTIPVGGKCDATGDTFSGDATQVLSQVRNVDVGTEWGESVYAAPGQPVDWVHCYYSGTQKTSGENRFKVNQSPIFPSSPSLGGTSIANGFVSGVYTSDKFTLTDNKPIVKQLIDNYDVETGYSSRVGQTLTEKISSSYGGKEVSDSAKTMIPYNFDILTNREIEEEIVEENTGEDELELEDTNSYTGEEAGDEEAGEETDEGTGETSAEGSGKETRKISVKPVRVILDNSKDVVFAGEKTKIKEVSVYVGKKYNSVTKDTYATRVDNAHIELYSCVARNEDGDGCNLQYTGKNYKGVFNEGENREGGVESHLGGEVLNVPDVSAGKYFCVKATYGPTMSNGDTDMESKTGEGSSDLACKQIAKKPSLQIWGGNIYSIGKINTLTALKSSLDGHDDGKTHVFGSWGELGVISGGTVKGLASGAGIGYTGRGDDGKLIAAPGGAVGDNFCSRSTLSFANVGCDSADAYTGGLNSDISAGTGKDRVNIKNFSDLINKDDVEEIGDGSNGVVEVTDASHRNIIGYKDLTLNGADISEGTYMVHSDENDIRITGDLWYSGSYGSLNSMPKLIVYAQNIFIGCNVGHIDAVLVAEDTIMTCSDKVNNDNKDSLNNVAKSTINDGVNSYQLRINGAVIANRVIANRTYGAATGNNSIVPAEIINFDPSLYLWGVRKTGDGASALGEKLTITNTNELAPRY